MSLKLFASRNLECCSVICEGLLTLSPRLKITSPCYRHQKRGAHGRKYFIFRINYWLTTNNNKDDHII